MITKTARASAAIAASVAFSCLVGLPAQAAPTAATQVERNVAALTTADKPETVWAGMSAAEKEQVNQEFDNGTVSVKVSSTKAAEASAAPNAKAKAFSGCWSRSIESTFKGGITKSKMFAVGQRTEVCVKKKKVTSVKVLSPYAKTFGYPGITVGKPTTGTYNASWEGRGVARVEATLGVTIPKVGTIGSKRTICAKLYLNANGSSMRGSEECQA